MKGIEDGMMFPLEFIFPNLYNAERVLDINQKMKQLYQDYLINYGYKTKNFLELFSLIDQISPMVIENRTENLVRKIQAHRGKFLNVICQGELERIDAEKEENFENAKTIQLKPMNDEVNSS